METEVEEHVPSFPADADSAAGENKNKNNNNTSKDGGGKTNKQLISKNKQTNRMKFRYIEPQVIRHFTHKTYEYKKNKKRD